MEKNLDLPLNGVMVYVTLKYPEGWTKQYTGTPLTNSRYLIETATEKLLVKALKQMNYDKENHGRETTSDS